MSGSFSPGSILGSHTFPDYACYIQRDPRYVRRQVSTVPSLKFSGNGPNYGFKSYTSERCNCYFVHVRHPAALNPETIFAEGKWMIVGLARGDLSLRAGVLCRSRALFWTLFKFSCLGSGRSFLFANNVLIFSCRVVNLVLWLKHRAVSRLLTFILTVEGPIKILELRKRRTVILYDALSDVQVHKAKNMIARAPSTSRNRDNMFYSHFGDFRAHNAGFIVLAFFGLTTLPRT